MTKLKITENETTNAIKTVLESVGYKVYKIYNGGVPARAAKGKIIYRKKDPEQKGVSDLIAVHKERRRVLFVECKSSTGKLKPEQKEFLTAVDSCLTSSVCANSVDDIRKFL